MAEHSSGLGYPTRWGTSSDGSSISSYVEESAIDDIIRQKKVEIITAVLANLDKASKEIIEERYFRNNYSDVNELIEALNLSKTAYYKSEKKAIKNFATALGYI